MSHILVVANETLLGEPLLERIRDRARRSPASFLVVAPQSDLAPERHVDAERRLIVCNRRYVKLFDLPTALATPRTAMSDILHALATDGHGAGELANTIYEVQETLIRNSLPGDFVRERSCGGLSVAVSHRPMPDGVQVVDVGIRGVHLAYDLLDGYDGLVLLDAVPRQGAPGWSVNMGLVSQGTSRKLPVELGTPRAARCSAKARGRGRSRRRSGA